MPAVVAAVAAIGTFVSTVGAWFLTTPVGAFLGKLALNFAISALVGKLFAPKKSGYAASVRENQVVVRSAIAARNIIYGRAVTSGPLVFAHTSGTNKEYLHLVIAIAGHEITEIERIFFNDEEIGTLDGSGNVTTGRFANYARIKTYLGTSSQTADADLVSESGGIWTANHRLQGVAYLYVRLKHSYDVYATGIPNIKAQVRGKAVYDPRDAGTRWTSNQALCARDYLISPLGLDADTAEIDDTACSAAANVCDERVTVENIGTAATFDASTDLATFDGTELRFDTGDGVRFTTSGTLPSPLAVDTTYYLLRTSATTCKLCTTAANARDKVTIDLTTAGSGTHQMVHWDQSRYTANGIILSDAAPRDNIQNILTSMAGAVVWVQGNYRIHAGAYSAPAFSLDEDDLRAPLAVQTKTPRKELFNAVRGVYVEPWKFWQPTDFTPVTNATYETQDGSAQIFRDIDLPMVANQIRAQRIAKIHLEKSRQGITVQFPAKIRAVELSAWDTVSLTVSHLGWSSKVFRVLTWRLSPDGGVDLTLQEESSASYSWSTTDATVVDAAPDTTLPSAVTVAPPTSLTVYSGASYQLVQADGLTLCRLFATWTAAADTFVTAYELQWKITTDSDYQTSVLSNAVTAAYIAPVQSGVSYHVRVRSVNAYGAVSSWEGPDTIAASSDATSVSVDYADVGGMKPPADADNTVAAVEAGATVTSGGITFSAGGNIKGGQTAYDTGTGWFIGYSGSAYKLSIGAAAGNKMTWDGTTLSVVGKINGITDVQTFTASGTWTKPSHGTVALIQVWGGGGAGGGGGGQAGGGGGGGGYSEYLVPVASLSSSYTVTVGAGGTGVSNAAGNAGGGSSFGTLVTAGGGGGGSRASSSAAGGAGGTGDYAGGAGGIGNYTGNGTDGDDVTFSGGGGGGAGGGATYSAGAGGTSERGGGAGGNGGFETTGVAGSTYGGGGGGSRTVTSSAGAAGAAGRVVVTVF